MSFKAFCRRNRRRDDVVGDIARDWCWDPSAPRVTTLADVIQHIAASGGEVNAVRAGMLAWNEYAMERFNKRMNKTTTAEKLLPAAESPSATGGRHR